jgi:hypothetical protein
MSYFLICRLSRILLVEKIHAKQYKCHVLANNLFL